MSDADTMSNLRVLHLLYNGDAKGGAQKIALGCADYNESLVTSSVRSGDLQQAFRDSNHLFSAFSTLVLRAPFQRIFCSDPRALILSYLVFRSIKSERFLILHSDKWIRWISILAVFCRILSVRCICTTKTQHQALASFGVSTSVVRICDIPVMRGPQSKTCRFVYFGRFEAVKKISHIVDLISSARRFNPDIELLLIGSGAETPPLIEGVKIISRWVSQTELQRLMSDCSFVVNATDNEGFSLQVMEGISNGLLPLVVSKRLLSNYDLPVDCKLTVENICKAASMNQDEFDKRVSSAQQTLVSNLTGLPDIREFMSRDCL